MWLHIASNSRHHRAYPRQCQDAVGALVAADACCSNVCGSCHDFGCSELAQERALLRAACPGCASWSDFRSHRNLSAACRAPRAAPGDEQPLPPSAVAIVQFFDRPLGEAPPHAVASAEAWRSYAAHHGYAYELGQGSDIEPGVAASLGLARGTRFPNWLGKAWLVTLARRGRFRHALQVDMDTAPVRPRLPLGELVGGSLMGGGPLQVAIAAEWGERSGGGRGVRASSHVNTGIIYYANLSLGAQLWEEALRRVAAGATARGYGFGAMLHHWPGDQGALSLLLRSDAAAAAAVRILPFGCPLGTPWGDTVVHMPSGPPCPGPSCVRGWDPSRDRTKWLAAARSCLARAERRCA